MEDPRKKVLKLESRRIVYEEIQAAPGVHFRELQRRTGLAVGALQYHLDVLVKNRLLRIQKKGKFVRYFPVIWQHDEEDKNTLSLMRQEGARRIALLLLDKGKATNTDLAEFLNLSPSTVSFHMQKLLQDGIVDKFRDGRTVYFKLKNPENAKKLFVGYKKSFLDEVVENFVDIWETIEPKE